MWSLPDRHGRWPLVAAAAAPLATAAAVARRDELDRGAWACWLPLPALLWHQTEEWVWPGGFLPWFNQVVMQSDDSESPITRRDGLAINVGLGWGLALAAGLAGPARPSLAVTQLVMDLANAGLHLSQMARSRRYNPGSITALLLFLPLGATGIRELAASRRGRAEVTVGAVAGALASAGLLMTMRRRARRSSPQASW